MKCLVEAAIGDRVRHQHGDRVVVTDYQSSVLGHGGGIWCLGDHDIEVRRIQARVEGIPYFVCDKRADVHGEPWNARDSKCRLCYEFEVLRRQCASKEPPPEKILKVVRVEARQSLAATEQMLERHRDGIQ